MDKLLNYVCDELEELERKADKGKLSMAEMQYVDLLAHAKKNLLTADAMMDADHSHDMSNARRRDSMGRYSRDYYSRDDARADLMSQLRGMERSAKDDETRRMVNRWIRQAEEQ